MPRNVLMFLDLSFSYILSVRDSVCYYLVRDSACYYLVCDSVCYYLVRDSVCHYLD